MIIKNIYVFFFNKKKSVILLGGLLVISTQPVCHTWYNKSIIVQSNPNKNDHM